MLLVLMLFAIARFFGGRGAGDLSVRQRRAALARSGRDLVRYEQRAASSASAQPAPDHPMEEPQ